VIAGNSRLLCGLCPQRGPFKSLAGLNGHKRLVHQLSGNPTSTTHQRDALDFLPGDSDQLENHISQFLNRMHELIRDHSTGTFAMDISTFQKLGQRALEETVRHHDAEDDFDLEHFDLQSAAAQIVAMIRPSENYIGLPPKDAITKAISEAVNKGLEREEARHPPGGCKENHCTAGCRDYLLAESARFLNKVEERVPGTKDRLAEFLGAQYVGH